MYRQCNSKLNREAPTTPDWTLAIDAGETDDYDWQVLIFCGSSTISTWAGRARFTRTDSERGSLFEYAFRDALSWAADPGNESVSANVRTTPPLIHQIRSLFRIPNTTPLTMSLFGFV